MQNSSPSFTLQIKDLNKGTFGFVQLAYDTQTNLRVAIKFIERGDKVRDDTDSNLVVYLPAIHLLAQ